jgi:hypothetical protein
MPNLPLITSLLQGMERKHYLQEIAGVGKQSMRHGQILGKIRMRDVLWNWPAAPQKEAYVTKVTVRPSHLSMPVPSWRNSPVCGSNHWSIPRLLNFMMSPNKKVNGSSPTPTGQQLVSGASLAVCTKGFVKHYGTVNLAFLKRQRKHVLRRNAVNKQVRKALEAEPFIVARISHERATFCTQ